MWITYPSDNSHGRRGHASLWLHSGTKGCSSGFAARRQHMTSANGNGHTAGGDNKARLVFWEVTKGCNLRCIHCRASATELSSPPDLPPRNALDILGQFPAAP